MSGDPADRTLDQAGLLASIEAQRCPWCGRNRLRSLANHTVLVHGIYADELREMAGLAPHTPLCSRDLSEAHRQLNRQHETTRWLHRPEVRAAGAATREAGYDEEQRRRRIAQLSSARPKAISAARRRLQAEKYDPELAAARRIARSKAHRALRSGAECPICGSWFCSRIPPGRDYRQRKYCTDNCRGEGIRRLRRRTWARRTFDSVAALTGHSPPAGPDRVGHFEGRTV